MAFRSTPRRLHHGDGLARVPAELRHPRGRARCGQGLRRSGLDHRPDQLQPRRLPAYMARQLQKVRPAALHRPRRQSGARPGPGNECRHPQHRVSCRTVPRRQHARQILQRAHRRSEGRARDLQRRHREEWLAERRTPRGVTEALNAALLLAVSPGPVGKVDFAPLAPISAYRPSSHTGTPTGRPGRSR